MDEPFSLQRFVEAQQPVYFQALDELLDGHKTTHWIWFILPQLEGLGRSPLARRYAISGALEARAYFTHPVLGPRLVECVQALLRHRGTPIEAILGPVDAMKCRSCLTLFAMVAPDQPVFADVLACFFDGKPDSRTEDLLGNEA